MITVTPQGNVYLCKTPLERDYKHQLTFTNQTAQTNYFTSKEVKSYTDYTYVKKDAYIVVGESIDVIRDCNYLFYKNTGFSDKIFYCFITKMEYVSENSTKVFFETDCFQTYYFNIDYKPCFVEREHVSNDAIGLHTLPESIETGEYEIVDRHNVPMEEDISGFDGYVTCFLCTSKPKDDYAWFSGYTKEMGGAFTPMYYFAVKNKEDAQKVISIYEREMANPQDAISNVYMIPNSLVNRSDTTHWETRELVVADRISVDIYKVNQHVAPGFNSEYIQPATLSGNYTPKNNRLFCYPFSYVMATNYAGQSYEYRWEDFKYKNGKPVVLYRKQMIASPSVSGKVALYGYKDNDKTGSGYYRDWEYSISYGKLPICAWTTDYYTNWLTQNGVNAVSNAVGGLFTSMGGAAAMALGHPIMGTSMMVGGIQAITSSVNAQEIAKITPDQSSGNVNTGDVTFDALGGMVTFFAMSVRPEYAKIADDYFSMFGYKVNTVKTPSITGRRYWNYVKTIDCNVEGDIPQDDLQTIRDIFNKGCTFWHDANNMYNYNLNNTII